MTIEAKIIADSISPQGKRITTFQLRYPRFIHAELMTHRMFSRNASSSRAIPVERMIADLRRDPAMPVYWGSNRPGMQAGTELDGFHQEAVKTGWLHGMERMIGIAEQMIENGLHKQIANRILEPWAHINVVLTATDYENFYALRRHSDAQPEIKQLADEMWIAQNEHMPQLLRSGEWHLPFADRRQDINDAEYHIWKEDRLKLGLDPEDTTIQTTVPIIKKEVYDLLTRISVARCARVSYLTHDGRETTVEEDLALYERLVGGMPLHASPAEHQATPDVAHRTFVEGSIEWDRPDLHGNFTGWRQYRKMLPGEFTPG